MLIKILVISVFVIVGLTMPVLAQDTTDIDGVPLPKDMLVASKTVSPFAGAWVGTWGGTWKTVLVVESVSNTGEAKVIYALGDNPQMGIQRLWNRYNAKIIDNTMTVQGNGFEITYQLGNSGRLKAIFGNDSGFGVMQRQDLITSKNSPTNINWNLGQRTFVKTQLKEEGETIALETIIYKPKGKGPFPLAVVNHGSTGAGNDPTVAAQTWTNTWFAELLNERGWIVAFPQRRGRGKSNGLYAEGISTDRSKGYTCEIERSLDGADRALVDIRAAVEVLQQSPEVSNQPILIAGNSRGGALSIAYAGKYPMETSGAINFVGGWMGSLCKNAEVINQKLFAQGGNFQRQTLWIYGRNDHFYPISHSLNNFEAFKATGGIGQFVTVTVAGLNNGHWAMSIPSLWTDSLTKYLDDLATEN